MTETAAIPLSLISAGALLLSACSTDRVTFVTSTAIGFDADPKKLALDLGYGRQELVIGPAYPDGGIPAVYAHLDSTLSLFDQEVAQLYATGDAAEILAGEERDTDNDDLIGKPRRMIFGTGSVFGLRLGFEGTQLPSVTLGYKRAEYSNIPLRKYNENSGEAIYHSAIAGIAIASNVGNFESSGVSLKQFIATGVTAEKLAENNDIQTIFELNTVDTLTRTKGVFEPDKKSNRILEIIEQSKECRNDYLEWARLRNYEPTILVYAKNMDEARKKAIDFLETDSENCNGD